MVVEMNCTPAVMAIALVDDTFRAVAFPTVIFARLVAPVPPLATANVPAFALETSKAVTGMVILAVPLNDVAVPVAPPDIAIVRAVVSCPALVAVAELPVQDPDEPLQLPVTLPSSGPLNLVAVSVPVEG